MHLHSFFCVLDFNKLCIFFELFKAEICGCNKLSVSLLIYIELINSHDVGLRGKVYTVITITIIKVT